MIKLNQPAQLVLTVSNIDGATDALVQYRKPSGAEGEWSDGVTVDPSAETVTYDIPANTLDELGKWRFVPVVTIAGEHSYPGSAHIETIYDTYK